MAMRKLVGSAIKKSGIDRKEIFLVSKVWIQDTGYEKTKKSLEKSLKNLQTDYLDLYLIHMPYGDYHGSWKAMEELYLEGKLKAIGVCNFSPDRLLDLMLSHEIKPMVNQIELHPFMHQRALRKFMKKHDIQPMAWAPFAEGRNEIFQNELLKEIADHNNKTSAQVVLKWLNQNKIVAIPKSTHMERIQENYNIQNFNLSLEELNLIDHLDMNRNLILDVSSIEEVERLHNIHFIQ